MNNRILFTLDITHHHDISLQIDYSDQIETQSIMSSDTAITLTNLISGMHYFINVTAITDIGETITNSTSVVTSKSVVTSFYLYM